MIAAYLMATAAAEAAGLPGGGMAFSTVAVICGVGTVGNCTTVSGPEATEDTDATEDDAGDRGMVGVIDGVGVETGGGSAGGGGVSVGVGSDMTSSMMVAGVDATDPSSSWR